MAALIKEEGLDEDGHPTKHRNLHCQQKCKCKQAKRTTQEDNEDDNEDGNFPDSSSGDESSSESKSDVSDNRISNNEVHFSLHIPSPYSHLLFPHRLLTCSHQRQHPVPNKLNRRRAHNKSSLLWPPQRLNLQCMQKRNCAHQCSMNSGTRIGLEMYQHVIVSYLLILPLPPKQ
jgi:hypothetical protein